MPSWKKLLVSGSDATLNSLQVTTNVTAAGFSGSFSGSFQGDGSGLTGLPSPDPFPYTGSAIISGSLEVTGSVDVVKTVTTQIFLNPQVLIGPLLVPSGYNGMLTGPVSNLGTITIESGSTLAII